MATQSEGQVQTEIKDRIALFHELKKFASVNSSGSLSNYIAREETLLDDPEGDYTTNSNANLRGVRGLIAQALDSNTLASVLDPLWRNYAKVVGNIVEREGAGIIRRLYKHFIDNSLTVNSRNLTYGTISAGSNLGSGTIRRLTVDAFGHNIEACHLEAKRAECVQDQTTGGQEHEEVFRIRGATRETDMLAIAGSGVLVDVNALSSRNSIITNASFSNFGGTLTVPDDISGWTLSSGVFTNTDIDETYYYRGQGGLSDATPRSLKFVGSDTIYQDFDVNGVNLNPDIPIYGQLAYNREIGSAAGTLTFKMGSMQVQVVLAAQTGWNVLVFPLTKAMYPRNFANTSGTVRVSIQWQRTSGDLYVDDVCIAPWALIDGLWYQVVGGASPFVAGLRDTFTWTDALAGTDSILQQWFWRLYGLHLPHNNAGAETWTDPTV
jgi:hypothetical protein